MLVERTASLFVSRGRHLSIATRSGSVRKPREPQYPRQEQNGVVHAHTSASIAVMLCPSVLPWRKLDIDHGFFRESSLMDAGLPSTYGAPCIRERPVPSLLRITRPACFMHKRVGDPPLPPPPAIAHLCKGMLLILVSSRDIRYTRYGEKASGATPDRSAGDARIKIAQYVRNDPRNVTP